MTHATEPATATAYDGDPVERLLDIEAIKQLKARYFRLIDTQQWDELLDVLTEDVTFLFPGNAGEEQHGASTLVGYARNSLEGGRSVHHGHMGEIEITGPDTAWGIWAMSDLCEHRSKDGVRRTLSGYGHYHERYVKRDGRWSIARLELTRLRVDNTTTTSTHLA